MQIYILCSPKKTRFDNEQLLAAAEKIPQFVNSSVDESGALDLHFRKNGERVTLESQADGFSLSGPSSDETLELMFELSQRHGTALVIIDEYGYISPELSSFASVEDLFAHMDSE